MSNTLLSQIPEQIASVERETTKRLDPFGRNASNHQIRGKFTPTTEVVI